MNIWFTEELSIVPGFKAQVQIKKVIHSEKSEFQQIDILESETLGRMLVLDNVIQCTEFDEFSYHEMLNHAPLFVHPNPKKVLIIGGGDGGSVREALKHKSVEEVHLCEIDQRVVDLCREHIPSMAGTLGDKRVHLHYEDGAKWARDHKGTYDVIVVDSSDPIGPAEVLFQYEFYEACKNALTDDGILTTQAENFFLHAPIIKNLLSFGKKLFPVHQYYYTQVPTYPGGMIGFTFFSRKYEPTANIEERARAFTENLKYWSVDKHKAAFVLPSWIQKDFFG